MISIKNILVALGLIFFGKIWGYSAGYNDGKRQGVLNSINKIIDHMDVNGGNGNERKRNWFVS